MLRGLGFVVNVANVVVPDRHPVYSGFEILIVVGDDGSTLPAAMGARA